MAEESSKENLILAKYSVKAIVENLKEGNSSMTYSELSIKLKELCGINRSRRQLGEPLGIVQDYCSELKLPTLPATVVRQDSDEMPGNKFITCYRGNHPDAAEIDEEVIVRAAQKACKEWKSWQKIYDRVGLDEYAPTM